MATSAAADLVGRVLAGRYRLLRPIGTGTSGRVYAAYDVRLRRRVAVKVLHEGLAADAAFLRRFRVEAQVAASLSHPNVMAVFDWGEQDGVPFMVLELLTGGSLRRMLDVGTRLTPSQATLVGHQVAAALGYAHARGVVHRDVKPANLVFDEHAVVRVADFGLARVLAEASWTEPASGLVGTARYAAPEQAGIGPVDGRSDLYGLAVVLVEAVTGQVPLQGETPIATALARSREGISAPAELGALAEVVERAGRPDPRQRYPDAAAMAGALTQAARSLPRPAPLVLPGLGDADDDLDTTRIPGGAPLFDQDAPHGLDETEPVVVSHDRPRRGRAVAPAATRVRPPGSFSRVPLFVGLAIVLALATGAGALVAVATGRGPTVAAPSLVGLAQQDAAARAARDGLLLRVQERTADDPKGTVLDQRPGAGAFVARGGEVLLVVSKGPPRVPLVDVTGRSEADATLALAGAGFEPTVAYEHDEDAAEKGLVLRTEPAAGHKAPRGSAVRIVVSDGPAPVAVPDVAGKTPDEATALLQQVRFTVVLGEDFSDTVDAGKVIRTDPAANALAPRDSAVTLVVSKGPELVAVPSGLVGLTVEQATARLQAAGLQADVQNYAPGRTVRATDPVGGTKVKKGSKVTLFL